MSKNEPLWKTVACPYCGSKPGYACTTTPRFAVRPLSVTSPHSARTKLADARQRVLLLQQEENQRLARKRKGNVLIPPNQLVTPQQAAVLAEEHNHRIDEDKKPKQRCISATAFRSIKPGTWVECKWPDRRNSLLLVIPPSDTSARLGELAAYEPPAENNIWFLVRTDIVAVHGKLEVPALVLGAKS